MNITTGFILAALAKAEAINEDNRLIVKRHLIAQQIEIARLEKELEKLHLRESGAVQKEITANASWLGKIQDLETQLQNAEKVIEAGRGQIEHYGSKHAKQLLTDYDESMGSAARKDEPNNKASQRELYTKANQETVEPEKLEQESSPATPQPFVHDHNCPVDNQNNIACTCQPSDVCETCGGSREMKKGITQEAACDSCSYGPPTREKYTAQGYPGCYDCSGERKHWKPKPCPKCGTGKKGGGDG